MIPIRRSREGPVFCREEGQVEDLGLALRVRWPDLRPLIAQQAALGLRMLRQEEPELVMVRDDPPDMDKWSIIKKIRDISDVPMVVAIEDQGEVGVVKALNLGADDYIRLPCSLMEVVARVLALMRRAGLTGEQPDAIPLRCGELLLNPATFEAHLGSRPLVLTPKEFKLLHLLAKNRHVTLTQRFIQRVIWTDETGAGEVLKKYVQRLRRKLGDDARDPSWIKTVHGVGYRFSAPTSKAA